MEIPALTEWVGLLAVVRTRMPLSTKLHPFVQKQVHAWSSTGNSVPMWADNDGGDTVLMAWTRDWKTRGAQFVPCNALDRLRGHPHGGEIRAKFRYS
ncbi:hypothetical protein MRX96_004005 [Rhipicephalus microplus]